MHIFKDLPKNMKKERRQIGEAKENQGGFLDLKNTISEVKASLHRINNRLDSNS